MHRVSKAFPAVELKFFGKNANTEEIWSTMNFHISKRLGETLFWKFVIPKLENLREMVGCQYLYLFAADNEPEGSLVNYYKVSLHLDAKPILSANKPIFDKSSIFLYQDINALCKCRDDFFEDFNPEEELI